MNAPSLDRADISRNFTIAKVLSILVVATGHFFVGSPWWIGATIGLSVFAFSSAYFTAQRYRPPIALGKYWAHKAKRLLPALLVINAFILALLLWRGVGNVFHWQTPVAMLGMSVLLDWSGVPHKTPFGQGLWFFAVLILFYCIYPLLVQIRHRIVKQLAFAVLVAATTWLQITHTPGYMLWLVVASFGFGVWAAECDWSPRSAASVVAVLGCGIGLVGSTYFGFAPLIKHAFLVGLCAAVQAALLSVALPRFLDIAKHLDSSLLAIYFTHGYIFAALGMAVTLPGYAMAMIAAVVTAFALEQLRALIFAQREKPT